jgi:DNA-directed RNA polymerase subunit RPC12/RpoP
MSEFKFACPVCGQHITADSSSSGGQLECPTCFQKILVPQAPSSADAKFILSTSQVGKPRPHSGAPVQLELIPTPPTRKPVFIVAASLLFLAVAAGAMLLFLHGRKPPAAAAFDSQGAKTAGGETAAAPKAPNPIPTNITWSLELTDAVPPETVAAGSIHGIGFLCERATLQGGNLTLRQGKSGSSDSSFSVALFAQQGEELSGKSIEIGPDRLPPLPRVTLRWRNDEKKSTTEHFNSGYALKMAFGSVTNGRMPGRIYLCLPDEAKSFVAGAFDAEIRKADPRRHPPRKTSPSL